MSHCMRHCVPLLDFSGHNFWIRSHFGELFVVLYTVKSPYNGPSIKWTLIIMDFVPISGNVMNVIMRSFVIMDFLAGPRKSIIRILDCSVYANWSLPLLSAPQGTFECPITQRNIGFTILKSSFL